jgi:hypothetical protein
MLTFLSCFLKRTPGLFSGLVSILALCGAADAGVFSHLDTNSDGVLSGKEVTGLKLFDADGDGEVSQAEFQERLAGHVEALQKVDTEKFKFLDRNEDGRLSGTEKNGWEFCDSDKDGRVTAEEYQQGLTERRTGRAEQTVRELQKLEEPTFRTQDSNKDGRLSGTEVYWFKHYDLNNDQRVTLEEYVAGNLLDSATVTDTGGSSGVPSAAEAMSRLAGYLNAADTDGFYGAMSEDLQIVVDPIILRVLLQIVSESHGQVSIPEENQITTDNSLPDGQINYAATLACSQGEIISRLTFLGDRITGFELTSEPIDQFNSKIYEETSDNPEFARQLGEFYSVNCEKMIHLILQGENDSAFAMFHPEVQQQLERKAVDDLFLYMRNGIGEIQKLEFVKVVPQYDAKGLGDSMSIRTRATGSAGELLIATKVQFTGMQGVIVGIQAGPEQTEPAPAPVNEVTMPDGADAADGWIVTDGSADGLYFWMPGTPQRSVDKDGMVSWILDHPASSARYLVQVFPESPGLAAETEIFFSTLNSELAKNTKGKVLKTVDDEWNGSPSKRLLLKTGDGRHLVRRDFVIGDKVYALQWVTSDLTDANEARFCSPFLNSFTTASAEVAHTEPLPVLDSEPEVPSAEPGPLNFSWLPAQTELVLNVQPAAMIGSPLMAPLVQNEKFQENLNQMIEKLGFGIVDIDSITMGFSNVVPMITRIGMESQRSPDPGSSGDQIARTLLTGKDFLVVVRFRNETDLTSFLREKNSTEMTHGGQTWHRVITPADETAPLAIWQPDSMTCVIGGSAAIESAIDQGPGESERESFYFVNTAAEVSIAAASPALLGLSAAIPLADDSMPPVIGKLLDSVRGRITAVAATIDAGDDILIQVQLILNEESAAEETAGLVNEGIELVRQMAQGLISGGVPEPLQPSVQSTLESLAGRSEGNTVSVSLIIPSTLISAVAENPELMNSGGSSEPVAPPAP